MRKCESLALAKASEYDVNEKLHGDSAAFFRIPESVIMDSNAPPETMTAFAYFSIKGGIDGNAMFSLNHMAVWSGRKPDKHKGMVNDRIAKSISYLSGKGYLSLSDEPSHASFSECKFDRDAVAERCENERYAVLYVDEVRKLLSSNLLSSSEKDCSLLLLAYLRMMMPRRINAFFAEESDVEDRRIRYPEVYNAHFKDIASDLGVTPRSVSKIAEAFKSIGLVYSETMPRTKDGEDEWHTGHTLFCNFYKREGFYLLASGEGYYLSEIERKKEKLKNLKKKRT